jgi:hypothetical protein
MATRKEAMIAYRRDYYDRNTEIVKQRAKKWQQNNKERVSVNRKNRFDKLRQDVLTEYGGKCSCCHIANPVFLTIDHINGGGNEHRRNIGANNSRRFYRWLQLNSYPESFQLLCWNCNYAKHLLGRCPHQES